jgi:hypothetical protein
MDDPNSRSELYRKHLRAFLICRQVAPFSKAILRALAQPSSATYATAARERAAVIDAHDNRLSIGQVRHSDAAAMCDPISRQHYKEMAIHYRSLSVEHQDVTRRIGLEWPST